MIEELISKALAENPDAEYELGCRFMDSGAGKQDAVGATKWWKLAASKDHPDAQFRLGEYLYNHSEPDGISWLTKAAQSGSDNAWNKLEQAAEQDLSRDARFSLGQLYLSDHENRPRNLSRAAHWLKEAALDGVPEALAWLLARLRLEQSEPFGNALREVLGTETHYIPDASLLDATCGFAAWCLDKGQITEAVHYYSAAARHGHLHSLEELLNSLDGDNPELFANAIEEILLEGILGDGINAIPEGTLLATAFQFGQKLIKLGDSERAVGWLSAAARQGEVLSLFELLDHVEGDNIAELLVASGEDEARRSVSSANITRGNKADIIWALSQLGNIEASSLWSKLKATETEANKFAKTALDRVVLAKQFLTVSNSESAVLLNRINSVLNQIATNTCVDPTIRKEAEQHKNKPIEPPPVFVSHPRDDSPSRYYPSSSNDDFVYGLTDT